MPVARGMSPTPPEQSQAISLKPREKLLLSTAVNAEMILASKDVARNVVRRTSKIAET